MPIAIGLHAHDLGALLAAAATALPEGQELDPALRDLQRALAHPTIAGLIAQAAASPFAATRAHGHEKPGPE